MKRVQLGQRRADRGELRRELAVEHDRAHVGVVEQVAQLVLDVAVVDVDRHRAELERGEHALRGTRSSCRGSSATWSPAPTPRAASACARRVGALVGLGERQAPVAAHERLVVGHGVGDPLPQVGEVELHARPWTVGPAQTSEAHRRRRAVDARASTRVARRVDAIARARSRCRSRGTRRRRPTARPRPARARARTAASASGSASTRSRSAREPLPLRGIAEHGRDRRREERDVHADARAPEARPRARRRVGAEVDDERRGGGLVVARRACTP